MTRNMSQTKRVLIVDDEPNVATMLSVALEKLGKDYIFEIAHSGPEALAKVEQREYALLITDYNMPELNGLDLAQAVRKISAGTQVILMTAYGTNRFRNAIDHFELDGYIDKPFTADQIRQIVKNAVERTSQAQAEQQAHSDPQPLEEAAYEHLKSLRASTGARCVLLLSSNGFPVSVVGETKDFDVSSVSALVAANFLAAIELANMLGNNTSIFKSSYHEGNDYNIYAYDVNGDLLLAVIFGAECKPGVVWFYTKQVAAELTALAPQNPGANVDFRNETVDAALDIEFNELFDAMATEETVSASEPHKQARTDPANGQSNNEPMSFEKAVVAGLVPDQILDREK